MMKVLILEEHGASYRTSEDGAPHPISDISEEDILAIVNLILDGAEFKMDEPPENDNARNAAELVIYRELYKQFTDLVSKRDEKLKKIDDKFKDAEAFYNDEELKNSLINLGQNEVGENELG
ncbi:hypothetical protein B5F40_09220 [Gordonibacter sp. An230]|uniref:hypothetical protein n=1 Tax=Gordonibacter sp. An230 TaxID=1965592 RepID=UPI000B5865A1|nr:hypothetical protein [Gordonibacter sp. An230]OUO89849.1 hypothetical protein B5F40_09220 [Gordonibacter sp. An230]